MCPEGWSGLACENGELRQLAEVGGVPTHCPRRTPRPGDSVLGKALEPLLLRLVPKDMGTETVGTGNLGQGLLGRTDGALDVGSLLFPTPAECLPGHYGAGCQLSCSCLNGGLCDRLTGHCLCPAGWTGDKCQSCE
jgi:hypothetical protein